MENKRVTTENQPETVAELKREIVDLEAKLADVTATLDYLKEQLRLNRHRQFGASSEKSGGDQMNLFNEAEACADTAASEPPLTEVAPHMRRRGAERTDKLPDGVEVEVVECVLPAEEQICPACESELHEIGRTVVRSELVILPAKVIIREMVQVAYACRPCENHGIQTPVLKGRVEPGVIPGSYASPEAIAHIATQKFALGVPLYRQEQDWARQGVLLSRQTMSNWLIRAVELHLAAVYEAMKERLLTHDVLHADETVLQVLREPGKPATSDSFMWVYRTSGDAPHPLVLMEYQPNRKAENPKVFLGDWQGYLHTDGYAGYRCLGDGVTLVACWAHARRKFHDAIKASSKGGEAKSGARTGREYCDRLFAIERKLAELPPDERREQRQKLARPVLDGFKKWLVVECNRSMKGAFLTAVNYTLGLWGQLENYLLDGRLEISNNRAERTIKPFVIDRKNFLFANTPRGAVTSAILFSIIETAKENGLNPAAYLAFLLRELPRGKENINALLPGGDRISNSCYAPMPKTTSPKYAWEEIR